MNDRTSESRNTARLASLLALALGFAAAGCSSNYFQQTKSALMNKLSNKADSTAANKVNGPGSTATAAAPATTAAPAAMPPVMPGTAAAPMVTAATPAMTPGAALAAYPGQMPVLPYQISTTDQAKAAGQSDACKNAKTGACSAFAGGSTNGVGQAMCLASCTANVCGQASMAQYYSQQAQANGMNCGQ